MRRVVITGIGLVTPLGIGTDATWCGLMDNRSAIGPIRGFDASAFQTRLAAEISSFEPERFVTNRRNLRMMTRGDQLAFAAAKLAVDDSRLGPGEWTGDRAALYVGGNKEISDPGHLLEAAVAARNPDGTADARRFGESAVSTVYPLFYVVGLPGAVLFFISQVHGVTGANAYFAGTAESGMVAVGTAYRAVRRGEAEVAVAGGFDDAVSWWNLSRLDALEVLSDRNELGPAACRPYDRDRSGAILGEGAAFAVLEEHGAAVRRGARVYAEVTGFGSAFDGDRLITPHPDGRGLARAMTAALREAETPPGAVRYVASHGSGTRLGDPSEARAIQTVFGPACDRLAASSVKAATGHLGAAAGALNVAVAALAIQHQMVPATLNLDTLDPACLMDWVPRQARKLPVEQALALARGFEGQSVALALRVV